MDVNEIYYYGTNTEFCDFLISDISQDEDGCSFRVSGELGCDVRITLPGIYNIYNVTAAMSAAKLLGVDTEDIKASVQKEIVIPGRMERFICWVKPYILISRIRRTRLKKLSRLCVKR